MARVALLKRVAVGALVMAGGAKAIKSQFDDSSFSFSSSSSSFLPKADMHLASLVRVGNNMYSLVEMQGQGLKAEEKEEKNLEEKFNSFASVTDASGQRFMTTDDLRRCLGYAPSNGKDGAFDEVLRQFGTGEGHLIDSMHFAMFFHLLHSGDADLQFLFKLADKDKSGGVSVEEYESALNSYLAPGRSSSLLLSRDSPLVLEYFGHDSSRELSYTEFRSLMRQLEMLVLTKEFEKMAGGEKTVPLVKVQEHVRSFVEKRSIAPRVMKALAQLETNYLPFQRAAVTLEEFQAVHSFLKHHVTVETMIRKSRRTVYDRKSFEAEINRANPEREFLPLEVEMFFLAYSSPETNKIDHASRETLLSHVRADFRHEHPEIRSMRLHESMLIGGVSAMMGATTVFPLDKTKTRMQSAGAGGAQDGLWGTIRNIVKTEGPLRLYRGLQAQLVGITPEKAVKLTVNDFLRRQMQSSPGAELSFRQELLAGVGTGFVQVAITNPIEVVKIRLQMQHKDSIKSPVQVVRELGVRGLYTGIIATVLRDVPFNAIYFSNYAQFKTMLKDYSDTEELEAVQLLGASAAAGVMAAALDTPADNIKTRLQNGQGSYSGVVDCFKKTLKAEGIKGLFRGIVARILIISPLFGITMMSYEILQRRFLPNTRIGIEMLDDYAAAHQRVEDVKHMVDLRYGPTQ